ncbi:MAG: bifunctional diguanylate cyclase/phosphodiesterase, partial [Eubacterium sp.]|nr:bifunctional diguanylate cyclase/phosphodiesterase [Eubacterium sp.]
MSDKSSGTYIIDENYTIISVNQTLRELYPSVQPGKKCYQCLMKLDEPCPPCPVANHIQGPQTYLDPIRGIYETVDAVEVELPDGKLGHALVMSTVGESEAISAKLPRTRNELNRLLEQEYFDSLTGGFSRKGFVRECERVFSRTERTDYAIILFDIHNFKAINDTFGIEGGDQILRYVFSTVRNSFLKPVVASRIESDSFLFLVRRKNISREQLMSLLNMEWAKDNQIIHFHLRCGIYYVEDADVSISRMINWTILANRYADQDKYGSYSVFDAAMREKYLDQAEVISRFSESLAKDEFKLFYQPIIETASGKICAAEALVRWNHPSRGFLVPGRFIPALEKSGLITQLDRYVLQHVYKFQKSLRAEQIPIVPVSVNLSRQDFYNDSFMSQILSLIQEGTLPANCINYEVTETSVAILKENCDYLLQQIRQIGSKILLDDFGSGYSSLGMIGDYSFDVVKIDKSFVDQIEEKPVVRAVIDATISMCHSIGLSTVA